MRVKVIQLFIRDGSQNYVSEIEDTFMPSVRAWCDKHSYDYEIITTCSNKIFPVDYRSYQCEGLLHVGDTNYDIIALIDNDIYVKEDAPAIELIDGLGVCCLKWNTGVGKFFNVREEIEYLNSGVVFINTRVGKDIAKHFQQMETRHDLDQYKDYPIDNDEYLLGEYLAYNDVFERMDDRWNFGFDGQMKDSLLEGNKEMLQKMRDAYFIHLWGVNKSEKFKLFKQLM